MPTFTTNYNLNLPNINSADDEDLWGSFTNENWESVDSLIKSNEETAEAAQTDATSALASGSPTGAIFAYAGNGTAPSEWLYCDGSAVDRTIFADLFSLVGITYGSGDGSTTFNLPELRAQFIRGFDAGRGVDSGRVFGSNQNDANTSSRFSSARLINSTPRSSSVTVPTNGESGGLQVDALSAGGNFVVRFTNTSGDSEDRPRNTALNYIIKT